MRLIPILLLALVGCADLRRTADNGGSADQALLKDVIAEVSLLKDVTTRLGTLEEISNRTLAAASQAVVASERSVSVGQGGSYSDGSISVVMAVTFVLLLERLGEWIQRYRKRRQPAAERR